MSPTVDNLPPQATPFFGRDAELGDIHGLLANPACRVLTLVGPGGIGKTRLALEAAGRSRAALRDGVGFVALQPLRSPDLLITTIAGVLGLPLATSSTPVEQLCNFLGDKELLLVLDNFEHLLDGAGLLSPLLAAAPRLTLLVTSREALNLQEEWRYPVQGLAVPGDEREDDNDSWSAVELFVERAARVRPDFSATAEHADVLRICRMVEGMPLAIELAAAWTKTLSCAEIARNLHLLETRLRDVPERHRSMRAAFGQSWTLLGAKERAVFMGLSVFCGGFEREAASAVADASLGTLASLVDKSLLRVDTAGRYRVHELLRQYADGQLLQAPDEGRRVRQAHTRYFMDFLETRFERMAGTDQHAATLELASEIDNIRTAWDAVVTTPDVESMLRAGHVLGLFYRFRGPYQEGVAALEPAIAALRNTTPSDARDRALARMLVDVSWLYGRFGQLDAMRAALEESEGLHAQMDLAPQPGLATDPLIVLGVLALIEGRYADGAWFGEAARRRNEAHQHLRNLPYVWYLLANAPQSEGLYRAAQRAAEQAFAAVKTSGDRWFLADLHIEMGHIARGLRQYDEARRHYQAGAAIREEFGDTTGVAVALNPLGKVAFQQASYDEAQALFERSFAIYRQTGDRGGMAIALNGLGAALLAQDNAAKAQAHFAQALRIAAAIPYVPVILAILTNVSELFFQSGHADRAIELLSFVLRHSGTERETGERAQQILARYEDELALDLSLPGRPDAHDDDLAAVAARVQGELAAPIEPVSARPPAADTPTVAPASELIEPLTARELDVLRLVANGLSNQAIAERLVLSIGTVKWYTRQVYGKLGVQTRTQAIVRAHELRLLP